MRPQNDELQRIQGREYRGATCSLVRGLHGLKQRGGVRLRWLVQANELWLQRVIGQTTFLRVQWAGGAPPHHWIRKSKGFGWKRVASKSLKPKTEGLFTLRHGSAFPTGQEVSNGAGCSNQPGPAGLRPGMPAAVSSWFLSIGAN